MDQMYDEFGNYIGPELDDDDSDGVEGEEPDDVRFPLHVLLRSPVKGSRPDILFSPARGVR